MQLRKQCYPQPSLQLVCSLEITVPRLIGHEHPSHHRQLPIRECTRCECPWDKSGNLKIEWNVINSNIQTNKLTIQSLKLNCSFSYSHKLIRRIPKGSNFFFLTCRQYTPLAGKKIKLEKGYSQLQQEPKGWLRPRHYCYLLINQKNQWVIIT